MNEKSYLATLKVVDAIKPTRRTADSGVNFLFRGDGFVWTKLFSAQSRGEAVKKASSWFFLLKRSKHAKSNIPHVTIKSLVVDDPRKEVFFYKKFRCFGNNNRLLEEEAIERLLKESQGKLRRAKLNRKKFAVRSSVEWNRNRNIKRLSYLGPVLKWTGFPCLHLEPDSGVFIYMIKKQPQKTVGIKYEFNENVPRTPMPRKLKSGRKDGRTVWAGKVIKITAGKKVQGILYKVIRLKAKDLAAAKIEALLIRDGKKMA